MNCPKLLANKSEWVIFERIDENFWVFPPFLSSRCPAVCCYMCYLGPSRTASFANASDTLQRWAVPKIGHLRYSRENVSYHLSPKKVKQTNNSHQVFGTCTSKGWGSEICWRSERTSNGQIEVSCLLRNRKSHSFQVMAQLFWIGLLLSITSWVHHEFTTTLLLMSWELC